MSSYVDHIQEKINQRKSENAFRELKVNDELIDFCSNDYLGFASEKEIHRVNEDLISFGATGSRLISGNSMVIEEVENVIAKYHRSESALIFNSGYTANLGFFSCVPQRGDTILYDEIIHASIRDGIRLSNANSFSFKHNDLSILEEKIKKSKGSIWVVVESIYSMDGDASPLKEISKLCNKYDAALVVDEAHAVGVFGPKGEGIVAQLDLEKDVFARIITFGKALGSHGAAILGGKLLRDYLINFSRPFIYTTAMPVSNSITIKNSYSFLQRNTENREKLIALICHFKERIANCSLSVVNSDSAIQCLIVSGNDNVKLLSEKIQKRGFDVRAILSPTVPKGKERLRICLHTFNSVKEVDQLIKVIEEEI